MSRIVWEPVIARAAAIAREYETPVTLRQLHYRLVSEPDLGYGNTEYCYSRLSELTAEARRGGKFPGLADLTRSVETALGYSGPQEALRELAAIYRRDRTEGQVVVPMIIAEKATLIAQLDDWFTEPFGIPVVALRGYHSESQERQILDRLQDRAHAVVYLGDHDPSGYDIERNAQRWLGAAVVEWTRVAIDPEVIERFALAENPGKESDSRARQFIERFGHLTQVEVEALDPTDLRELVRRAIAPHWDTSHYNASLAREADDRAFLQTLCGANA